MSIYDIVNPETAQQFRLESQKNSIHSEVEIMIMSMADMKDRCEIILTDERLKKQLSEDELIDIGQLKEKMVRFTIELDEILKRI